VGNRPGSRQALSNDDGVVQRDRSANNRTANAVAGVSVAALAVPQSMAYAGLAGVPPQVGLIAVIAATMVYALVGSSPHLSVGPEPGTAALAATSVAFLAHGEPGRTMSLMAGLALLTGVISIIAWLLRFGFVAELLSRPILVGYLCGVAVTLAVSQAGKAVGVPVPVTDTLARIRQLAGTVGSASLVSLCFGAGALVALMAFRRLRPSWPGALVVVVLSTVMSSLFEASRHGVAVVGPLPTDLVQLRVPNLSSGDVRSLLLPAVGLTLVGYSDNILTARAIANRHGHRIRANRELVALAATNAVSGLAGGMPLSSSASRTALAASLGATSRMAGLIAGVATAAAVVGLSNQLGDIPQPVLAAVVISAALSIVDLEELIDLWRLDRAEFGLAAMTAVVVVVTDVLTGVVSAVGASIALLVVRIARPHDVVLGAGSFRHEWIDVEGSPPGQDVDGVVIYRFDAPLCFANAQRFHDRVTSAVDMRPGVNEAVVLDLEGVSTIDSTGIEMLDQLVDELSDRGVSFVATARASHPATARLERAGILSTVRGVRAFATIESAVQAAISHDRTADAEPTHGDRQVGA
jgi:sulfate permease, SulP family